MQGQRILHERYRVDELIGRGGMADVFRGHDLRLNRTVAVKMMRPDLARDPAFQARFRTEARHAAALNHPNIVSVYDTGDALLDDGPQSVECPYLVMEHVDGRTLRELLDAGEVAWRDAVEWTRGLLHALDHSHRQRIVHRDVKPANVMVTRDGGVKVMDFGIARALSDTSAHTGQTQAVVGTALYLPPEQAQGARVDARSDLYAAGCVLFELLTGRPPFTGETPLAIAYQHVREEPPAPSAVDPSLSTEFDSVVLRALQKDPGLRHQHAREFLSALDFAAARAARAADDDAPTRVVPASGAAPLATGSGALAAAVAGSTAAGPTASGSTALGAGGAPEARPAMGPPATTPLGAAAGPTEPLIAGHAVAGAAVPGAPSASQLAAAEAVETAPAAVSTTGGSAGAGATSGAERAGRRHRLPWAVLAAVAAVAAILALGAALLIGSRDPGPVTVPALAGRTEAEAVSALTGLGLRSAISPDYHSTEPDGRVLKVHPGAGAAVEPGSTVNLSVARGGEGVVLPTSLRGASEARVRQELARLGLNVASVEDTPSGELDRGALVQTDPVLGSRVPPGSAVVLHLADGTARVPSLVGMTGADARTTLAALDPEMTVRFQGAAGADPDTGVVVLQDPAAGTVVDNTAMITLITSAEATPTASAVTVAPPDPALPSATTTTAPAEPSPGVPAPTTPAAPAVDTPAPAPATTPAPAPESSSTPGAGTDPAPTESAPTPDDGPGSTGTPSTEAPTEAPTDPVGTPAPSPSGEPVPQPSPSVEPLPEPTAPTEAPTADPAG